ncbi:MAG: DUF2927 domain-containing protein [Pseudomonadota bacterium]
MIVNKLIKICSVVLTGFLISVMATGLLRPANAATDAEIIRGFNLTMFGAEYSPFGYQSNYIRKFNGTVRFYIHNLSRKNRTNQVARFIRSLNGSIRGLKTEVTNRPERANFHVYVVDRKDYISTVRDKVYRRPTANTPGKCLVRSVFSRSGIRRSDAVIVSDEGESLFKRCTAEEILQGLGPLNEHVSLRESMFNDRTRHTNFTRFDKLILNMLYDRRIANGAQRESVQGVLPDVLRDAKRRVR